MKAVFERSLIVALSMGVIGSAAFAGATSKQQVTISDTNMTASGDLGYVRRTADSIQYIGCSVNRNVATCVARNAAGVTRSCTTSNAEDVSTARALNGDSSLLFWWNAEGQCQGIIVRHTSMYSPK